MSSEVITAIDDYQAMLINRNRKGSMLLGGQTLYILEVHPAGYKFDEAVKAACSAVLERDTEDLYAGLMQEYRQVSLPNALKIDGRSAPRRLGRGRRAGGHSLFDYRAATTVTYTP